MDVSVEVVPCSVSTIHVIIIIFLGLATFLSAIKLLKRSGKSCGPLPPGPWKLPVIGNLLQMVGDQPPHRRLMDLAKRHGPIMHLQLGEISNIIVSSPEIAKEFLRTHDHNYATRPIFPAARILSYGGRSVGFSPYGDYWRQMRKICTMELLSGKRVDSLLKPIMEDEIRQMVRSIHHLHQGAVMDLSQTLYSVGTAIISRALFGKLQGQEEAFLPVLHGIVEAYGGFALGNLFPSSNLIRRLSGTEKQAHKVHEEADVILEAIIDEHVATRKARSAKANDDDQVTEDLVDVLLNFKESQGLGFPFTNADIKAVILDMFLAGSDTFSSTVEWAISQLIMHPDVMKKAQAEVRQVFDKKGMIDEAGLQELSYLKAVVKESLRLYPPAPLLVREGFQESVLIAGYQIPKKSKIMINVTAISQDPRNWTEPERFYPDRFIDPSNKTFDHKGPNFDYIPFGGGRRICPGISFGSIVVDFLLASLLYHFDWQLPNGIKPQDLDMCEKFGSVVTRQNHLHLIPIAYKP